MARRQFARTGIMTTIPLRARLMATTDPNGSSMARLSGSARGFTDIMGIAAITAAAFTVVVIMAAGSIGAGTSTADGITMAGAAGSSMANADFMVNVGFAMAMTSVAIEGSTAGTDSVEIAEASMAEEGFMAVMATEVAMEGTGNSREFRA
jgi:hypothetical protein